MKITKRTLPGIIVLLLIIGFTLSAISLIPAFAAPAPGEYHKDTPAQSIEKIKAINPNFIKDSQTQPTFQFSSGVNPSTNTATIYEEVWIEVPCDTDEDGKRDMIRIQIARPADSGVIINPETGETKVSLGVLMEHSPYRNNLSYSYLPNWPVVHDQITNPSSEGYKYLTDVKTKKPRAPEWYWDHDAAYWDYTEKEWVEDTEGGNASWYVSPRKDVDDGAWFIPKSRGDKDVVFRGNWPSVVPPATSVTLQSVSATYQYFYTRGYAVIISASLGNAYRELESEGFTNCGDVEETLVCMAIIKWLNGECKGYTDRAATKEVVATWCNGNVAMTGQSYVGTLPQATACSGVDGIKAILPIAAISSWYDYYRANGTVVAAYNYQGEDADELTDYCFGRRGAAAFIAENSTTPKTGAAAVYEKFLNQMHIDQDRNSGDYNTFWDNRNYLTTIDNVPDDCGIMAMHGLNDWNVKTKQIDQFYRALKSAGKTVKEIWHLGAHTTVWDKVESHYMEYYHLWLDHFLYLIDNNAVEKIPEVNMNNPNNVNWEFYDKWPIAGSTDTRFYFGAPTGNKAGSLLDVAPAAGTIGSFKDDRVANANISPSNTTNLTTWENRLFNPANIDTLSTERIAFATDILKEPLRINGTVRVGLELSSNTPWGSISAVLVEAGTNYRAFGTSSTVSTINSGFGTSNISLNNYTISNTSSTYKIITRGYGDIQNPNPAHETYLNAPKENGYIPAYYYQTKEITPGEKNIYYFEFDPNDYTFKAGTRLVIYVFTTDYRSTIVPVTPPTFTLYAGENSFVDLPIVPTYSIFYNGNGGTSYYSALGGFSDTYPIAGQSASAWEGGYRIPPTTFGNTTVIKMNTAPSTFLEWNTKINGIGIAFQPGDRIPDEVMATLAVDDVITFYAIYESAIVTHNVTIDSADGNDAIVLKVRDGAVVGEPDAPEMEGFVFLGWYLDEELYDFGAPVTADITLVAKWERIPITFLKIASTPGVPAVATLGVKRNSTIKFDFIINEDAIGDGVVWSVANTVYATVDENGTVTIKNVTGTVVLIAKDIYSGVSHSIILRIT
jgi:putative CocE/NonD family hydrolase